MDVDSFHYDDEDADKCYLKLAISTSSTKYYFVDNYDYNGSDGLDELDKKVNDDDEDVSVNLELNEDGKIEDMTIK